MSSVKHLINSVENAVNESLTGLTFAYPQLEFHESKRIVLAPGWRERRGKVSVICGGGSGHEPFSAGFVGKGMLSAAVAGSVYAAPSASQIAHAIKCVSSNNEAGCLVLIPNYTGDCLNFGLAIEKATSLGIKISKVLISDDCSIPKSEQGRAGSRGLCGSLFMMKIAGALSERGESLENITRYTQIVADNIATCAVGLSACAVPGQTHRMFEIATDEIEFGMGIHGEAGYKRIKLETASKVVSAMLEVIEQSTKLVRGDFVAVIVNNFGALSQLEQGVVLREVIVQLRQMGINPVRVYSGVLVTSLDGSGIHISVLKLPENKKSLFIDCLDDKTDAPYWPGCNYSVLHGSERFSFDAEEKKLKAKVGPCITAQQANVIRTCLRNACEVIVINEADINDLDSGCGDGDCGSTLKRLAEGILSSMDELSVEYPSSLMNELAVIAEERMGGTSGALYSLMFTTAAMNLAAANTDNWGEFWAHAFTAGIKGIMKYSKAKLGDRTMLDVLVSTSEELQKHTSNTYTEAAKKVIEVAKQSCEETIHMVPKAGRASYVKQAEYLRRADAGAFAVSTWICAIAKTVLNETK